MRQLYGREEIRARIFIYEAARIASKSGCLRSKCGSVIVQDNEIIGKGFNSSPNELDSQKRCLENKTGYSEKITDKTCCVHAEQRAIIDALKTNAEKIHGSTIYFIKLNKQGMIEFAGRPYCTICSKIVLDVGIKDFVLFLENGIYAYDTEEYNDISFRFKE